MSHSELFQIILGLFFAAGARMIERSRFLRVVLMCAGIALALYTAGAWAYERWWPVAAATQVGIYESDYKQWDGHHDDDRALRLSPGLKLRRPYKREITFVPIISCWIPNATIAKDSEIYLSFFGSDLDIPMPKAWIMLNPDVQGIWNYQGRIDEEIICGGPPPARKIGKGPNEYFTVRFPKPGLYSIAVTFEGRTTSQNPQVIHVETRYAVDLH